MRTNFLGQNLESSRTYIFSYLILKPENNEKSSVFLSRLGTDESSFPKRSFAATWPHSFRELCELYIYIYLYMKMAYSISATHILKLLVLAGVVTGLLPQNCSQICLQ